MSNGLDFSSLPDFLKQKERVLICLPNGEEADLVAKAITDAGCIPVLAGDDLRWMSLLRRCFAEGIRVVAGHCDCVLGLAKMATVLKTPLRVRNVVITHGYCPDWMVNSIEMRLDCRVLNLSHHPYSQEPVLLELYRELLTWTSVLDVRMNRSVQGLELDMVYFAGEKMPRLPCVARQVVRPLDPNSDSPFFLENFP